ncbi:MAG: ABC transporter ATP-binding protein [gamma proteobacterium symbiont of Bathyaustriella thionipta]|nr:ABC transporter ATP-binding protein [gamma proteobacterium symbiont of Bathyaustriella thionipta]
MAGNSLIHISDLVTHFGDKCVHDGINLDVRKGEILVIMGGSGSGKSTLMRCLLGLKAPSSGSVQLLGQDLFRSNRKQLVELRRQMGVAFQGGALFGSMTVGENVCLPLREHTRLDPNTMRIMARMKLEMVNLGGAENLMPAELSGGMIKRAAFARSMIMDPKLLFFDEPSAGLDPITSAELDELILRIRDAMQTTIVVVTHELESAFRIADRITLLHAGKILMTGSVEEVQASDNQHIQDMLKRKPRSEAFDVDRYLSQLTGDRVSRQ